MAMNKPVQVFLGAELASYGFGQGHPFSPQRMSAFEEEFNRQGLKQQVQICEPQQATEALIKSFHSPEYVEQVKNQSETGEGYLDYGDTPAFKGVYTAAAYVVGSTVAAAENILAGRAKRGFVPIAGLHHGQRSRASGFCVFNDCCVLIETLRHKYGMQRIVYVDIDAHHGDGVFYAYNSDPQVLIVDFHEDGLYPGTGSKEETGKGKALGSKLNFPLPRECEDPTFLDLWPEAESFIQQAQPEFIILQCGADSIKGDPITHLNLSPSAHVHVTKQLCGLAEQYNCGLLALGGGGYNLTNIAQGWCAVVSALLQSPYENI